MRPREPHFSRKAEETLLSALEGSMFSRSGLPINPPGYYPAPQPLQRGLRSRETRGCLESCAIISGCRRSIRGLVAPCPLVGSDAMLRSTTLQGPGPCTGAGPQQVTTPIAREVFSVFEMLSSRGYTPTPNLFSSPNSLVK